MTRSDTVTVRLDAGRAYRIPFGDDEVITSVLVCAHCDAIHLDLDLPCGDPPGAESVRFEASLELDPWNLELAAGETLPDHVDLERLSAALAVYKEALAARADRLFQIRDRDHWRDQDLSFFEPGVLVPYKEVFPGDFDLITEIGGRDVWFEDYHCMTVGCPCTTATIFVVELGESAHTVEVGEAEIDLTAPHSRPRGDPQAASLLEQWLGNRRNRAALEHRRSEIRRIAALVAKRLGLSMPAVPLPKVGRNDPCPCGSGKKYKRCCLP